MRRAKPYPGSINAATAVLCFAVAVFTGTQDAAGLHGAALWVVLGGAAALFAIGGANALTAAAMWSAERGKGTQDDA